MNVLPRADKAIIPIEKFTEYSLNPEKSKDKATAFEKALGYNLSNYQVLVSEIRSNLTNFPAEPKPDFGHGTRYEVVMKLVGPNGKTANVLTAWIDDNKNGEMRLINAYIDKEKGVQSND